MKVLAQDLAVLIDDDRFVFVSGRGQEVVEIPAYVAISGHSGAIMAYGVDTRELQAGAERQFHVQKVLVNGLIGDVQAAKALFGYGLRKCCGRSLVGPRVLMVLPWQDYPKSTVEIMAKGAGARAVFYGQMGIATAVGMQWDVEYQQAVGVLSVGPKRYEFCVISGGQIVAESSGALGSDDFLEDVRNHLGQAYGTLPAIEELRECCLRVGVDNSIPFAADAWATWARPPARGGVFSQSVSSREFTLGMLPSVLRLSQRVKDVIRTLPQQQQTQLESNGLYASGSGMAIPGLAELLSKQVGLELRGVDSSMRTCVEGSIAMLEILKSGTRG